MEKLVKLLNEYVGQDSYWIDEYDNGAFITWGDGDQCFIYEHIISKKFGFIKWLVENDKINWWRIENNQDYAEYLGSSLPIEEYGVEILLMLLAIADDPINYLCCIIRQF